MGGLLVRSAARPGLQRAGRARDAGRPARAPRTDGTALRALVLTCCFSDSRSSDLARRNLIRTHINCSRTRYEAATEKALGSWAVCRWAGESLWPRPTAGGWEGFPLGLACGDDRLSMPMAVSAADRCTTCPSGCERWARGQRAWPQSKKPSASTAPSPRPTRTPTCPTSPYPCIICASDRGRWTEGLAAIEEAVRIRRSLAKANPEQFDAALQHPLQVIPWLSSLSEQ